MTSRFSDWFGALIGRNLPVEEKLDNNCEVLSEDSACNREFDAYLEYQTLKRAAHIHKARQQINDYDKKKKAVDDTYKTYEENFEEEVAPEDINEEVDRALDIEQKKKLGIFNGRDDTSYENAQRIEEQNKTDAARKEERTAALNTARESVLNYDREQLLRRDDYKTYEQICAENEEEDNKGKEQDDEMQRILMEKLGIYNETDETTEIKLRRLMAANSMTKTLNEHENKKKSLFEEVARKMADYHEKNKNREDYKEYDCEEQDELPARFK